MTRLAPAGRLLTLVLVAAVAGGCAAAFMKGGTLVKPGFVPPETLVRYRAEGQVPAGYDYLLVRTEQGEAMFERAANGSGALFETHWSDDAGDHFAGWVATSHGYEFVVPKDRQQPASKYVYPRGTFRLVDIDGVTRPVPTTAAAPVATLHPL